MWWQWKIWYLVSVGQVVHCLVWREIEICPYLNFLHFIECTFPPEPFSISLSWFISTFLFYKSKFFNNFLNKFWHISSVFIISAICLKCSQYFIIFLIYDDKYILIWLFKWLFIQLISFHVFTKFHLNYFFFSRIFICLIYHYPFP